LNLYRYVLGKHYGINVSSMILASFHPDLDDYFMHEVACMDKEIQVITNDLKRIAGTENK
jgi:hypothetical protein